MNQLLMYRAVEQVTRFDILISDPHAGDGFAPIEETENLTLQEVWDWLSLGGEWAFRVTAHGNPEKIFMRGLVSYESMRDAVAGKALMVVCNATDAELTEFEQKVCDRIKTQSATRKS